MMKSPRYSAILSALAAMICPVAAIGAPESLGVVERWGAFRDAQTPRCYAISQPSGKSTGASARWKPFAAVGYWPRSGVRGQINIRLSREIRPGTPATLLVGEQRFTLVGGGADAWAANRQMDAAILAALRSGSRMVVGGTAATGTRFADVYQLRGAATAIDAAALGCSRFK